MSEHEFKGDSMKMAPRDYVQYHYFTHCHDSNGRHCVSDGDVAFTAEIICVHTFNNENLDVFHPLYDEAPSSDTVKRAIVTHTPSTGPTKHEIIVAENFHALVWEWVGRLEETCRQKVRRIVVENYAFLEYLT